MSWLFDGMWLRLGWALGEAALVIVVIGTVVAVLAISNRAK